MSSFKKRVPSAQASLPPGCRLSAYNGQVLISTGVPSLDDILGGGLPLGTILLIQEDRQTSYGQLLLKYFLRQGIVAGDRCAVISGDEPPEAIVRSLMGIAGEESLASLTAGDDDDDDDDDAKKKKKGDGGSSDNDDKLTIAWRYSSLKKFESGVTERPPAISSQNSSSANNAGKSEGRPTASQVPFCEQFDLTTRISAKALESADTVLIDSGELMRNEEESQDTDNESGDETANTLAKKSTHEADLYRKVLDRIRETLIEGGFSTTLTKNPNDAPAATPAAGLSERHILRIGINSIASPSWRSKTPHDLYKFLHALRGLLRFSFGAAVITIPAHLYGTPDQRHPLDGSTTSPFIHKIEQLCDASVRIESFAGAQTNAASAASAYHGLFHVHKVPVLNALVPSSTKLSILLDGSAKGTGGAGSSSRGMGSLGFKVRRKRFAIETFHLPPEGGVGQRRTTAPSSDPISTSKKTDKPAKEPSSTRSTTTPSSSSSSSSSPSTPSAQSPNKTSGAPRRIVSIGSETHVQRHTHAVPTGAHDPVPGASGVARKMMGLPPLGLQGSVSSGCSTPGTASPVVPSATAPRVNTSGFARRTPGQGFSRSPSQTGSNTSNAGGGNPLDF